MIDATIVAAAIADRAAYELVAPHITTQDMTPAAGFWFGLVGEWYSRDPAAKAIDPELLRVQGEKRAPAGKHREPVMALLRDLPPAISPINTGIVALELLRHNAGMELAAAIAGGEQRKIPALSDKYAELLRATELYPARRGKWHDAPPAEEIFQTTGAAKRIPLAPDALNARIGGGALPGHHIVVFGRPDAGKSTFALNAAAVLGVRHGQRVLYVGNEDQINVLKRRCICRVACMTWEESEADPTTAIQLWRDSGAEDRIKFAQLIDGGIADLPAKIEEHQATVLIVDQLRGLSGQAESMTARLEANAIALRAIILRYQLIGISVTQANDRSSNYSQRPPVWLGLADVDSSRTGVPGTADLLIGIGCDEPMLARGQRALSLPKNKLSSAPGAHDGIIVEFDASRSRIR